MHTANLRKVGGSVVVALPPALLNMLELAAGATVGLSAEQGRLVIEPKPRPRYTLDELLAQCDFSVEYSPEEREWIDAPAVGREEI
jgi:antitoxin ChpS